MKKFIALSIVCMVLAGAGFAEVAVTGQVDAVVMPLQVSVPDEGDTLIGAGVGRNAIGQAPRARIGITASNDTEQVGINFKVRFFTNGNLGIDDFAEVWWKPIPQLKIEAGKFVNDTLRGKIGDDNWHRYTTLMKDADGIFSRFNSTWGGGTAGFMLGISPIDPLFIGVSVPSVEQFIANPAGGGPDLTGNYTYWENDKGTWSSTTVGNIAHTYEKIQAGVGFTIENIGLVRAQYVGASYIFSAYDLSDPSKVGISWLNPLNVRRIEAAFAFTGMEGLVIDVGGKIPFAFDTFEAPGTISNQTEKILYTTDQKYQAPFQISLGAGYTLDALDIKGRVDAQFAGGIKHDDWEYKLGPDINIHLWPSYNLGVATVGLDVGFNFIGDSEIENGNTEPIEGGYQFGIGAWLKKTYGGSSIKGGLALSLGEMGGNKLDTVFSVPIIFDYTF